MLSLTSSLATSLCWIQVDVPHWMFPTQASMCPRGVFWLPSTVQRLASEVSWHLQTVSRRERECGCLLDPWRSGNSPRIGWPAVTLRQLGYAAGCRNLGCSMEMNSWMMDIRDLWYISVRLPVAIRQFFFYYWHQSFEIAKKWVFFTSQSKACIDEVSANAESAPSWAMIRSEMIFHVW